MNYQTDFGTYTSILALITRSEDGYLRMTLETLFSIPLVHLLSGLNDDSPILPQEGASITHISGYTDWISTTLPVITLGWDWLLDVPKAFSLYIRLEAPSSNVMLIDALQLDFGFEKSSLLLGKAIDELAWQEYVRSSITSRYV